MVRISAILLWIAIPAALITIAGLNLANELESRPCEPFEIISGDPLLNKKLKSGLTDFINNEDNRQRLLGVSYRDGYIGLGETYFAEPFFWLGIFDESNALLHYANLTKTYKSNAELILKFDSNNGKLAPPYRIEQIGVYSARSLIMYKNENKIPYTRGKGTDRFAENSYVVCRIKFDGRDIFE